MSGPLPPKGSFSGIKFGQVLLERKLGEGGMGVVYLATHTRLQKRVAVKLLRPDVCADPQAGERFLREARSAARIEHPSVVKVYDMGEQEGTFYIVMQYVEGPSLEKILQMQGPLPVPEAVRILKALCAGVEEAHRCGIIHRDLKPDNVLLGKDGSVVLVDFGLARAQEGDPALSQPGKVFGTPHYMSPEQALGKPVDCRSDIFSLGSTFYRMVTGRHAFNATTAMAVVYQVAHESPPPARAVNSRVPAAVSELIDRMMQKNPERRFASVKEVLARLEEIEKPATGASPAKGAMTGTGAAPAAGAALGLPPSGAERHVGVSSPSSVATTSLSLAKEGARPSSPLLAGSQSHGSGTIKASAMILTAAVLALLGYLALEGLGPATKEAAADHSGTKSVTGASAGQDPSPASPAVAPLVREEKPQLPEEKLPALPVEDASQPPAAPSGSDGPEAPIPEEILAALRPRGEAVDESKRGVSVRVQSFLKDLEDHPAKLGDYIDPEERNDRSSAFLKRMSIAYRQGLKEKTASRLELGGVELKPDGQAARVTLKGREGAPLIQHWVKREETWYLAPEGLRRGAAAGALQKNRAARGAPKKD